MKQRSPYIIAEIGINHDGNPTLAKQLVRDARTADVDAVKFQMFHPEMIDRPEEVKEILRGVHLSEREIWDAAKLAHSLGLDAIVTPFGELMYSGAAMMNCWDAYKVSHAESHDDGWIRHLAASGKPVIVSYTEWAEKRDDVIQLWCCPKYPTPLDEVNWAAINHLEGFSDHTSDIRAGEMAVRHGATTIEVHITHNRHADGPDHKASLEPSDLVEYVRRARLAGRTCGLQRNPLIDSHLDQVFKRAKVFAKKHPGEDYRDYVTSGYIGLDRSASRFDAAKNAQFSSFAFRKITGAIWDQWREECGGRSRQTKFERGIQVMDFSAVEALR